MRISKLRIQSFGAIKDREFEVSPGLTVFYGPNESGKTTTMEFIRTVMAPTTKRNQYPERRKSDSGSMEYEEGGAVKAMELDHKVRKGDLPDLPNGVCDPELYRSIFAMDSKGLDDDGSVERLKSRFLTAPGGERMPAAMEACASRADELIGRNSRSGSEVNRLGAALSSNADRIASARAQVDEYGDLVSERGELASKLADLDERSKASERDRTVHELYRSQNGNYATLTEMERKLAAMGDFREVTADDINRCGQLSEDVRSREGNVRAIESQLEGMKAGLKGADPGAVRSNSGAIDDAISGIDGYRACRARIDAARTAGSKAPEPVRREIRRTNPLVFAGALLAVVGLAGMMVSTYLLVLAAAGAVVAVAGLMRPKTEVVYDTPPEPPVKAPAVDPADSDAAARYESGLSSLMSALNLMDMGAESDVRILIEIRAAYRGRSEVETGLMKARMELSEARAALAAFYSGFGGEAMYRECCNRTMSAARLKEDISNLRSAISKSGLDPDVRTCPVTYTGDGVSPERAIINRRIGEIDQKLRGIAGDREIEALMDARESLRAQMGDALREGAVALIAKTIADDACEDIYSTVQPGVTSTACRYLSMMTDGRYTLDTNPVQTELAVRSGTTVKPASQWSSGLRAQVLLSVKLAIAREMGEGRVPMILDDVLLPFDSKRKEGACRAIAEMSSEMQILMFTCDRETAEICNGLDSVKTIRM